MSLKVQPGQLIAGKYVIKQLLGQGGMGAVFVAHQAKLHREVAIKFLLPSAIGNEEAVSRFEREAQAAAVLQSDHVTRVYDVGHIETGEPYIVMELLKGEDLGAMLARRGPIPPAEVIAIIIQACEAIGEAHALGIVHRDLKPANIFLAERPNGTATVKVLDFGISKVRMGAGAKITVSASLVGSPLYMSPEQVKEARTLDERADIWALGVTLYELLTGQPPFTAQAVGEICSQILTMQPERLRSKRPDLPVQLESVVMRCLRKEPSQRFPTIAHLVAELKAVRASLVAAGAVPDPSVGRALASVPPILSAMGAHVASPPRPGAETARVVSSTLAETLVRASPRKLGMVAAVAASAIVLGGAGMWGVHALRQPVVASGESRAGAADLSSPIGQAAARTAPAAATISSTSVIHDDKGIPSAAQPASVEPPSVAVDSLPTAAPGPTNRPAKPRPTAIANAVPAPAPVVRKINCDPPYYFDAKGNRLFKRECL